MTEPAPYIAGDPVTVNGHTGVVVEVEQVAQTARFGLRWRLTVDLTDLEVKDTVHVNDDGRNFKAGERVRAADPTD